MTKSFLTIILLLTFTTLYSQYRDEYGVGFGTSNYLGDLGGSNGPGTQNSPVDMRLQAQRVTANFYYRRKLSRSTNLKIAGVFTHLYGEDAMTQDPYRRARNLSFKTNVSEIDIMDEWVFFHQTRILGHPLDSCKKVIRKDFRAFFSLGIGMIYFEPKTTLFGKTYRLRPLATEGVNYSPVSWAIPFGMGLTYTLNKKIRIGADLIYRITGSDYLDDVSGAYSVSYDEGANGWKKVKSGSTNNSDIRAALGNRTHEVQTKWAGQSGYDSNLPIGANYDRTSNGGTPRGGAWTQGKASQTNIKNSSRDGYVTLSVSLGIVIKGTNKYYREKKKMIQDRRRVVKKRTGGRF